MTSLDTPTFVALVDHTLLAAVATESDLERTVAEALRLGTAAVCINGCWVDLAVDLVGTSSVAVCTVIGFPLGASSSAAKAAEGADAIDRGASEIDMVVNLGQLIAGNLDAVESDIDAVRTAIGAGPTLKVILETAALTNDQIIAGCRAAEAAGADLVKTSTGFHAAGGASIDAVQLMAATVGGRLGVKASGGIRTLTDVMSMVAAGATRLGMSATLAVVDEIEA